MGGENRVREDTISETHKINAVIVHLKGIIHLKRKLLFNLAEIRLVKPVGLTHLHDELEVDFADHFDENDHLK